MSKFVSRWPDNTCPTLGCGQAVHNGKRCLVCQSTLARLRGMRPHELERYERTSRLRLARLAIVRDERRKAGI